jgi:carbohydrate diacid regulator
MNLSPELAQSIVKSTMEIVGKNINIMDKDGITLASGSRERINTFHQIAAEVTKTGRPVEIDQLQCSQIEGVRPGISLPITFNEKIIGVVGITGDPNEVRGYGQLLKNMVELMLKDSFLRQQLQVETGARDRFIRDLLKGAIEQDVDIFNARAQTLGYELEGARVAMAIDIVRINGLPLQQWLRKKNRRELHLENLTTGVLNELKQTQGRKDMITQVGQSRIVILKLLPDHVREKDLVGLEEKYADAIKNKLANSFALDVSIGIGGTAPEVNDIQRSYQEASLVLKITKRICSSPGIYHWDKIGINLLLESTPKNIAEIFQKSIVPFNDELKHTLKVFFKCNLSVNQTAKQLYVHRNTITYRLDQVEKLTGLNPRNFYDAMYLYFSIMLDEYHN